MHGYSTIAEGELLSEAMKQERFTFVQDYFGFCVMKVGNWIGHPGGPDNVRTPCGSSGISGKLQPRSLYSLNLLLKTKAADAAANFLIFTVGPAGLEPATP